MGIHQRIIQFNHCVWRHLAMESPHDTNRLRYITSDLFTWSLKVRFSSSVTPRNLTVETFVKIVTRILMLEIKIYSNFLVGDHHIWSFTNVQRKSVGLEPVINSCQFPVHCGMNIVNVTVGCKNCCIVSKMNKAQLVWGSMHVIDVQKKKYWAQHRSLRNT